MSRAPDSPKNTTRSRRFWDGLGKAQIATLVGILALLVAIVSATTDLAGLGLFEPDESRSPLTPPPTTPAPTQSTPSSGPPPTSSTPTFDQPVALSATHTRAREVTVTAEIFEQPRSGYVYWFVLEVHLVSGTHSEWYPRSPVTRSATFPLTISAEADITRQRTGAVYEVPETVGDLYDSGRPDAANPDNDFLLTTPCQCAVSTEIQLGF